MASTTCRLDRDWRGELRHHARDHGAFDCLRSGTRTSHHGLWLLVNVLYDVDTSHLEVSIPKGKAGILTAKDGAPLRAGQAFADPFPSKFGDQMLDAEVFLLNGGQRGPQLTVLTPAISFKAAPKWKFPRTRTTPTLRCSSRWKAGTCPSNCASLRGYRQRKRRVWWPASAL